MPGRNRVLSAEGLQQGCFHLELVPRCMSSRRLLFLDAMKASLKGRQNVFPIANNLTGQLLWAWGTLFIVHSR